MIFVTLYKVILFNNEKGDFWVTPGGFWVTRG